MNVLAISGRRRDAAVAVAVDGTIAAAATEACCNRISGVGYSQTGGFPVAAVDACLTRAGLSLGDVDEVAVVEERAPWESADPAASLSDEADAFRSALAALPVRPVDPIEADARQLGMAADTDGEMVVFSEEPSIIASYARVDGQLAARSRTAAADRMVCAARTVARAIGVSERDPFVALDRRAAFGEPELLAEFRQALRWRAPWGVDVDPGRVAAVLHHAGVSGAGPIDPLNVMAQERRDAVAASFVECVAELIRDAVTAFEPRPVSLGGSLFAGAHLNTRVRQLLGTDVHIAAVPEGAGRVLGAAANGRMTGLKGLALGPTFTEVEIKSALDNCRLDYVYEPDWRRLLNRISKMLSRGMVVAWFQGPMVFGPRSLGTRSILCDPSTRYARENVNDYLRRVPLDEPLPVSFAEPLADECLAMPMRSPYKLLDAPVKGMWRDRLRSALDHRHWLRIHTVTRDQAPELCDLLDLHVERTGVPGLINIDLKGPGEPTACTPRDALRTVYSSAIDALVIGRFLLMKDYWLLRSDAN